MKKKVWKRHKRILHEKIPNYFKKGSLRLKHSHMLVTTFIYLNASSSSQKSVFVFLTFFLNFRYYKKKQLTANNLLHIRENELCGNSKFSKLSWEVFK